MSQGSQKSSDCFHISFTKGMTLEQFMAGLKFSEHETSTNALEDKQQNLHELSANFGCQLSVNKKGPYQVQGIEEENEDESRESLYDDLEKDELPQQLTKATFRQTEQQQENQPKNETIKKLNNTAYFGNRSNEKNTFRVKQFSNSPAKKNKQTKLSNNSMTLYGAKFNYSKEKESKKLSQLITFYGKISSIQESLQKKTEIKKLHSKRNFKKKNPLQIHEIFQFQNKAKNKYSTKICLPQIKVESLKDKILERKNKFL